VATIDRVTFEPESWDPPGPIRVVAMLSDGGEVEVFRYYSDELRFSPDDLVGRSHLESRARCSLRASSTVATLKRRASIAIA